MVRIIFFLALMITIGCVDQIDFDSAEEIGTLVVDGAINNPGGPHFIQLSRTDVLGKRVFPPETGAQVTVFDDLGNSENYSELGEGKYVVPGQVIEAKVGQSFHIEIVLQSGRRYRSEPERIFPALPIDRITYTVQNEPLTTDENKVLPRSTLTISAEATFGPDEIAGYTRYQVDHAFIISEILCSPLQRLKSCYVTRNVQGNGIKLLDGTRLTPGAQISREVATIVLDYALGLVAGFRVSQQSLSRRAYDYWTDLNLVTNNVGTIFDSAPAAIRGNVVSIDDPDEEVLGFFGAYAESEKVLLITNGEIDPEFRQLPLCGLPGLAPPNLDPACCECLRHENSRPLRPEWWPN